MFRSLARNLYLNFTPFHAALAMYARTTTRIQRVALVVAEITANGDAVSNDVLGMRESLAASGIGADIFTIGKSDVPGVRLCSARISSYDLVIYHYSTHQPHLLQFFRRARRFIFKYHNITPSRFFDDADNRRGFYRTTETARKALPKMIGIGDAIADSEFNRSELIAIGMPPERVCVVPPFHQTDSLLRLRPRSPETSNDILTVGRIVPNKGFDLMLNAFSKIAKRSDAMLHIVGGSDARLTYRSELDAIVEREGIQDRVVFHGNVSKEKLAALYQRCRLFWTASQHEGFCVPAVEAMAFGKPIVSTSSTALPETCGQAAVFADSKEEMVSSVLMVLQDEFLQRSLGEIARHRYEEFFIQESIGRRFAHAIKPGQS